MITRHRTLPARARRPSKRRPPRAEASETPRGAGAGALVLLLPLLCCGGPLVIAAAASAGALGWGALGAGVAVLIAIAVLIARRHVGHSCNTTAGRASRDPQATHMPRGPSR